MIINKRKYLKEIDDAEILVLYKKDAWSLCIDELFHRYAHLLYGVMLKYTHDKEVAADLLMELFEKLPQLILKHEIVQLKQWLHIVARNEALQYLRSVQKKPTVSYDAMPQDVAINNGDETSTEDLLQLEQQLVSLEKLIPLLKPQQAQCIRLFFLEQLSYEEIMKQTQLSFKEVKSHLQNGKRNLRILMEQNNQHENN
ncbi:MAG: RNA polymerase sigma factor [Bacteroidota bacterium]